MNKRKLYLKALNNPKGLRFNEAVALAEAFGFVLERIRGSHHMLRHPETREFLNLQPDRNGRAKEYQVRQFLAAVEANGLSLEDER